MQKYLVVTKKIEGFLCFSFDKLNYLKEFRNCTWNMPEEATRELLSQLGYTLTFNLFMQWVADYGYEVVKIKEDISFDRFYAVYDRARDRHVAERSWNGIRDLYEREYMFCSHEAYQYYCLENASWYKKAYAGTFLQNHRHAEYIKLLLQERKDTAKK